ncbi:MAG: hypothetical protein ACREE0_05065, partial [Phenylobacterium sp.]
ARMTWAASDDFKTGCLDGGLARINNGSTDANGDFRLLTAADAELAQMQFANPAFGAAAIVSGNPVAAANAIASDTSITAGTVAKTQIRDRNNGVKLAGSVGLPLSGADLELTDITIDVDDIEAECVGLTFALVFP